jgi:hypothetical protein
MLHSCDSFACFNEGAMACCNPLGETKKEMVDAIEAEMEHVVEVAPTGGGEAPVASDDEGRISSGGESGNSVDEDASDNENSRAYCFGGSTITQGRIKEMADKGYFMDGEARAPVEETIPEPNDDEAIVFEDFFMAGLRMPLHSALADILLRFQAQLHQQTPNTIALLSKYFWAVDSFGGVPSGDAFAKRYELHYQPKKIESDEGALFAQYGCLNFHGK